MKTRMLTQRSHQRAATRSVLALGLALAALALLAPSRSDAGLVIKGRVGNVGVVYRDGDRYDQKHVCRDRCGVELEYVADRVLAPRRVTVERCDCDGKFRSDRHRLDAGWVWVPGHWEKRVKVKGKARGHGHRRTKIVKVWVPGQWQRR